MYSQCSQYNVSWGDVLREGGDQAGLEGDPSWEVVPCQQGWEYRWVASSHHHEHHHHHPCRPSTAKYHVSLTVEQDWVCDRAWIPALSQSLFFTGAIPGMLTFGWLSDWGGRVPAILASNLVCLYCTVLYCTVLYCTVLQVCLVTGLLTPLVTSHTTFFLLRFLQGFAYNSFYAIAYVLGKMKYSIDL